MSQPSLGQPSKFLTNSHCKRRGHASGRASCATIVIYIYIYICMYTHTYMYTYIYIYITYYYITNTILHCIILTYYVCIYIYTHIYIYIYIYICHYLRLTCCTRYMSIHIFESAPCMADRIRNWRQSGHQISAVFAASGPDCKSLTVACGTCSGQCGTLSLHHGTGSVRDLQWEGQTRRMGRTPRLTAR